MASLRLIEKPQPAGCQNCGESASGFEVSRLVEVAGELDETPVVAIRHWCRICADLLIAHNWKGLADREKVLCQQP